MDQTEQAREYAQAMRGEWARLSADTGLGYHWLGKFAQGKIRFPAYNKIDLLIAHRNGRKKRKHG